MHVAYVAHSNVERLIVNIQYIELFTSEPVHYHIISHYVPPIRVKGNVSHYNIVDECKQTSTLAPFITTHPATVRRLYKFNLCKLYLARILSTDVETVLLLDIDTVVTQTLTHCYPTFAKGQYLAMARDTGALCQQHPDRCWPVGFTWDPPSWMRCNVSRERYSCAVHSEEPVQFNGGVIGMHLARMREVGFVEMIEKTVWNTYRMLGGRGASYAEQDFLNNYLRFHPESLVVLSCECNYQFSSARKRYHCANRRVAIAHAWSIAKMKEPLYKAMTRFDRLLKWRVIWSIRSIAPNMNDMRFDATCRAQPWACDEDPLRPTHQNTRVFYLTRTMRRPFFYAMLRESVRRQSHARVTHIVSGEAYANASGALFTSFAPSAPLESACDRCGASIASHCTRPSGKASFRDASTTFGDCYCSLSYPPNAMIRAMQETVRQNDEAGFVVILDDDKVLADDHATTRALALAYPEDTFLIWRGATGRYVPNATNFAACRIQRGDIDGANMIVHTSILHHALWTPQRCGDYRSAANISRFVAPRCLDTVGVVNNPLQHPSGGLGRREDVPDTLRVTLLTTTTHLAPVKRRRLLARNAQYYRECCRDLITSTVLVWNAPENATVPAELRPLFNTIVHTRDLRLENRWLTRAHVSTEFVLNLDDDASVTRKGILCLLANAKDDAKGAVWGPFSRRIVGDKYILEENYKSSYSMILPKVMLFRSTLLDFFATFWKTYTKKYISRELQYGVSDDIIFNMVATQTAQVRWVILPTASFLESISPGISNAATRQRMRDSAVQALNHSWSVVSHWCRQCDDNVVVTACADDRERLIRAMRVFV